MFQGKEKMISNSRMKVHIIGGGPTGMSIAWELLNNTEHEVHIYDKKDTLGGSWHEPKGEKRDFHAPRMLFNNAFVNTQNLFKEMNMDWNTYFVKRDSSELYSFLFKHFKLQDYFALTSLAVRVLLFPEHYRKKSLEDSVDGLSFDGKLMLQSITYSIDGVGWDVMTAYEFVQSFNQVGLSSQWQQRISGRKMGLAMQKALLDNGLKLHLNTGLTQLNYTHDGFEAVLSDDSVLTDDLLILCLDNFPASSFVQNNWGPSARDTLLSSAYTCLHVLFEYDEPIELKNELELAIKSPWNILTSVLPDGKTVSCVMCNLTEEIITTSPDKLYPILLKQLDLPDPVSARITSDNKWENGRWIFTQSSGVINKKGQLPFFGENKKVAMCGMMSPRYTVYSSIEAGIEVGRTFCHQNFKTRKAQRSLKVTQVIILIVLILILINEIRRRNL